jgi:hypothetical protein
MGIKFVYLFMSSFFPTSSIFHSYQAHSFFSFLRNCSEQLAKGGRGADVFPYLEIAQGQMSLI